MTQQEPEYVWYFPPERPRRPGLTWLVVGLAVAAVGIAIAMVFLFLPRTQPAPEPTDSAGPTATATPGETATPTPVPTVTATRVPTPVETIPPTTPPPPADPALPVFRDKVRPVLTDADTGLRMLNGMSGTEAVQIVDQLKQDGERLSDSVAPSSIADAWSTRSTAYLTSLTRLRDAYTGGSGIDAARNAAVTAEQQLKRLVGL